MLLFCMFFFLSIFFLANNLQATTWHKKLAKAKDVYDKAIVLLPNSPLMHMGLGDVYRAQKQNALARKAYERGIELAKTMSDPALADFSDTLKKFKETL